MSLTDFFEKRIEDAIGFLRLMHVQPVAGTRGRQRRRYAAKISWLGRSVVEVEDEESVQPPGTVDLQERLQLSHSTTVTKLNSPGPDDCSSTKSCKKPG